jgi:hypothetical protein
MKIFLMSPYYGIVSQPFIQSATSSISTAVQLTYNFSFVPDQSGLYSTGRFHIERSLDGISFVEVGRTQSTSYGDTGLTGSTLYYYRVRWFSFITTTFTAYSLVTSATTQSASFERVFTVNTNNTELGSTPSTQIRLYSEPSVTAQTNYIVDWGDGSVQYGITASENVHSYATAGTYTIRVVGVINQIINFAPSRDRLKYVTISQWGSQVSGFLQTAFWGCTNLQITATDAPNLSLETNLRQTFRGVPFSVAAQNSMDTWNVSNIVSLENTFRDNPTFNGNVGGWNVSNVTEMQFAFYGCTALNRNFNSWDVRKCENFRAMFQLCPNIKLQPFNSWQIGALVPVIAASIGMNSTFADTDFQSDITSWNMIRVNSIASMFRACPTNLNYNFGLWDIRNVSAGSLFMGNATQTTISASNLANIYIAWAQQPVRNIIISFGTAKYDALGASARAILVAPRAVSVANAIDVNANGVYTFSGTRYQNPNGWYFSFVALGVNQWRLFDPIDVQQAITTGSAPQQHGGNPMSGVGWTGNESAITITLVGAGWTITDGGQL